MKPKRSTARFASASPPFFCTCSCAHFGPRLAAMRLALSFRVGENNALPCEDARKERFEGAEIVHFDAARIALCFFSSVVIAALFVVVGLSTRPLQFFPPLLGFCPSAVPAFRAPFSPLMRGREYIYTRTTKRNNFLSDENVETGLHSTRLRC